MPKRNAIWRRQVRRAAARLNSDGCTWATEAFQDCCFDHDRSYREGKDFDGNPISKADADREFRECMQAESIFGKFSPMAGWRWLAVKWFGKPSAPCAQK